MSEESTFVIAKLRASILAHATVWMTVDDLQRELTAERERAGEKPAHVPIQLVQQCLNQMLEQGGIADRRAPGQPLAYRINRLQLIARWGKVLLHLANERDSSELESKLLEKTGASMSDVAELESHGLLTRKSTGEIQLVVLSVSAGMDILKHGSEAVVAAFIPMDADDREQGQEFAAKTAKQLIASEEARKAAEGKIQKVRLWLAFNGIVDMDGLIAAPVGKPARTVFDWTTERTVDPAEKGVILEEIMRLETDARVIELRMAEEKTRGKGELEKIAASIAALKSDAHNEVRVIATKAYKEFDWKAGLVHIRDDRTNKVLESQPIPRGEQKSIDVDPPAAAPAPAAGTPEYMAPEQAANGAPAAANADPRPTLTDTKGALLGILRGATEPLSIEDIVARFHERYIGVPERIDGPIKDELGALKKAKKISLKDKKFALIPEEPPPADAGKDDAPGPFADPERRRRGSSSEDQVQP